LIRTRTVRITDRRLGNAHRFWTSLEGENPSGSIKDRMVEPELSFQKNKALAVSEISAGSTALSISYYAMKFQMHCRLFVPKGIDPFIKSQLVSRGAVVKECDPATAYEYYNDFIKSAGNEFWSFGQMARRELSQHYKRWAQEELKLLLPPINYVVGSIGTGHSLAGITEGLNPFEGGISIEPAAGTTINGIRNSLLNSFGAVDPWNPTLVNARIKTSLQGHFDSS